MSKLSKIYWFNTILNRGNSEMKFTWGPFLGWIFKVSFKKETYLRFTVRFNHKIIFLFSFFFYRYVSWLVCWNQTSLVHYSLVFLDSSHIHAEPFFNNPFQFLTKLLDSINTKSTSAQWVYLPNFVSLY